MTKLLYENHIPPKLLYKYRDFGNKYHKRLITNLELYFPSIKELNDPFEGKAEIDWYKMSYKDCLKQNEKLLKAMNPRLKGKSFLRKVKKITDSKKLFHPDNIRFDPKENEEKWNQILGVVSLSEKYDDIHMWSIYANSHKGFAVGLSSQSILNEYDFDYLGLVDYFEDIPTIGFDDDTTLRFKKKFFTKSIQWKNESEWRITKNHIENRTQKLKIPTIKEIIFGANAQLEDIEWCKTTIEKYKIDIRFRQAFLSKEGYKMEVFDI